MNDNIIIIIKNINNNYNNNRGGFIYFVAFWASIFYGADVG